MKRLLQLARTLHLYLSLLGCVLIAFFAVSGFMLSHEEWFGPDNVRSTRVSQAAIPGSLVPPSVVQDEKFSADAQRKIEQWLRREFHLRGELKEPVFGEGRIDLIFESAGRTVTASIALVEDAATPLADRKLTLRDESTGFIGRLCELHRKTTKNGAVWKRLVDVTAIVLLMTALTGLVMWLGSIKRRWLAAAALVAGAVVFALAYFVVVP